MQAALSTVADMKRTLLREAEDSLRGCVRVDPADPRSYVVLGKLLVQQKRYDEARKLYADGTTATGKYLLIVWSGDCRELH
jgi:cytochrome c-type biogenesis protein CcmH/NrfG